MLFVTWAVLGNKPPDQHMLRSTYLKRLLGFQGTRYVWGGESHRGVDCSGLARAAFWQAMGTEGLREVNPRLLGPMTWKFWWHDISATDLFHGKYKYTKVICSVPKLAGFKSKKLKQGDIAITTMTPHVLIYLGKGNWIEANPDEKKVVINKANPNSDRTYFNMPATIVRWWILDSNK